MKENWTENNLFKIYLLSYYRTIKFLIEFILNIKTKKDNYVTINVIPIIKVIIFNP